MPNLPPAAIAPTGNLKDAILTAMIVLLAGVIVWFAVIDWQMRACGFPVRAHSDRAVGAFLACMQHHGAPR